MIARESITCIRRINTACFSLTIRCTSPGSLALVLDKEATHIGHASKAKNLRLITSCQAPGDQSRRKDRGWSDVTGHPWRT